MCDRRPTEYAIGRLRPRSLHLISRVIHPDMDARLWEISKLKGAPNRERNFAHQFQSRPPRSSVLRFFFAGAVGVEPAVAAASVTAARLSESDMRRDFSSTSSTRTFTSCPLF